MKTLLAGAVDFNKIQEELKKAAPNLNLKFTFEDSAANQVGGIISEVIPYLFVIAGLLFLFYLIYGGFHMIFSAGNEKGLTEAKAKITNALLGFLLLFISYWIVQILQFIFGFKVI